MFNRQVPLYVRLISLFHIWFPPLLLWIVYRLGYDSRAWLAQSTLAWAVLVICYRFTKPTQNVNWVFGPLGKPQDRVPPALYLFLLMLAFAAGIYLPTHFVLRATMPTTGV